jgi:hypothetical protein
VIPRRPGRSTSPCCATGDTEVEAPCPVRNWSTMTNAVCKSGRRGRAGGGCGPVPGRRGDDGNRSRRSGGRSSCRPLFRVCPEMMAVHPLPARRRSGPADMATTESNTEEVDVVHRAAPCFGSSPEMMAVHLLPAGRATGNDRWVGTARLGATSLAIRVPPRSPRDPRFDSIRIAVSSAGEPHGPFNARADWRSAPRKGGAGDRRSTRTRPCRTGRKLLRYQDRPVGRPRPVSARPVPFPPLRESR